MSNESDTTASRTGLTRVLASGEKGFKTYGVETENADPGALLDANSKMSRRGKRMFALSDSRGNP